MIGRGGIRTRLLLASTVAVAIALILVVGGFNLVLRHELDRSATDRARARATAELAGIETAGGHLHVAESADAAAVDIPVWVFSGSSALETPRVSEDIDRAARRLASSGGVSADVPGTQTRLYAVPVESSGRRLGTVVAAVSLAPYADVAQTALVLSVLAGAVLLGLLVVAGMWLLGRALAPVSEMTAAASIWSEHDLDRRFGQHGPRDEIGQLAETLDALLERIAAALKREQRLSSEISHELRTPLARIRAEADLALRRHRTDDEYREALATIVATTDQLTQIVETLLDVARVEAGARRGSADAAQTAQEAMLACQPLAQEQGVSLSVIGNGGRIAVDPELALRVLQPLLENACRYGSTTASIAVSQAGANVRYDVRDDGPGVRTGDDEAIFEPGIRGPGSETANGSGAGLGLALARRVARAAGGDVYAEPGASGHFVAQLPALDGRGARDRPPADAPNQLPIRGA